MSAKTAMHLFNRYVVGLKNSRFPADDVHIVVVVAGLLMALVTPILHMCDEAKGLRSVLLP